MTMKAILLLRSRRLPPLVIVCVLAVATSAQSEQASCSYDSLNRLTRFIQSDGSVISYTYDGAGNRLTETVDTTAPSLAIGSPTSVDTYATTSATIDLGGTASDDIGVV